MATSRCCTLIFLPLICWFHSFELFAWTTSPNPTVASNVNSAVNSNVKSSVRLEDLVTDVTQESELLQSLDKNIESLDAEIRARDLLLTSQLTIEAANLNDNRDAVTFARRTKSRFLDIIYDQAFSTGTLLSMTTGHDRGTFDNFGNRNTGDFEVRLTQSLWRDAFGQFTSYRRQGDRAELQNRKAGLIYQKQLVFIDLEALYWELAFAVKEEEIRLKNIEVSKNLKNWTTERLQRVAAEKSDVLQAKALLSGRELDLITTRNQIESVRNRFRQLFINQDKADLLPDLAALEKDRPVMSLIAEQGALPEPKRLDSIVSEKLVVQAEMEAKKVREQLKPQLDAYVSYGQNGIATTFDDAWARAGDSNHSATRVGVLFKIPLNRKLTQQSERSAQLTADANRLKAQYLNRASKVGWEELVRQVNTLKGQVQEATRLAEFQIQKVKEERRRFRLGRSTVFQLVTFEADAAEAEVRKYRFLTDLRKAESQARLFTMQEVGA